MNNLVERGWLLISKSAGPVLASFALSGRTLIGRARQAEVFLPDLSVSRRHALIELTPDAVRLRDLGSKNGTTLNGRPVSRAQLAEGDRIGVGCFVCEFRSSSALGTLVTDVLDEGQRARFPSAPPPESAMVVRLAQALGRERDPGRIARAALEEMMKGQLW